MEPENAVVLLRVLPMLCGLAQVEIAFRSSRIAFPRRNDLQIIGTVVGGFLPMNLYISQTVGNEPLSGCLTALLIYCAFKLLVEPTHGSFQKACGRLGLLFGLALLAKVSAIVLLPAILLVILYVSHTRRSRPGELALASAAFFAVSALVAGWYYLRNWILLGSPFVGGWERGRGFDWWQDPGYRIPEDLFSFGESLTFPVFSSLMGFWDGLYSTLWLDGLRSLVTSRSASPQWNHEFMLCMALLSIPLTIAGLAGALSALRKPSSGATRVGLFSVACLGSFRCRPTAP
jgi:4-amino-4-deoxy-L-arabinose transferase-like glycosyltransferase